MKTQKYAGIVYKNSLLSALFLRSLTLGILAQCDLQLLAQMAQMAPTTMQLPAFFAKLLPQNWRKRVALAQKTFS